MKGSDRDNPFFGKINNLPDFHFWIFAQVLLTGIGAYIQTMFQIAWHNVNWLFTPNAAPENEDANNREIITIDRSESIRPWQSMDWAHLLPENSIVVIVRTMPVNEGLTSEDLAVTPTNREVAVEYRYIIGILPEMIPAFEMNMPLEREVFFQSPEVLLGILGSMGIEWTPEGIYQLQITPEIQEDFFRTFNARAIQNIAEEEKSYEDDIDDESADSQEEREDSDIEVDADSTKAVASDQNTDTSDDDTEENVGFDAEAMFNAYRLPEGLLLITNGDDARLFDEGEN